MSQSAFLVEEPRSPITPTSPKFTLEGRLVRPKVALSAVSLCALMYANVIGSAFGSENAIGAGGAMMTIIAILLLPIVQGFPLALACTELSTTIPSNGGFLMWFNCVYHPVVYFTTLLMTLVWIVVDTATFPSIFTQYTCELFACSQVQQQWLQVGLVMFSGFLNAIGVEFVGVGSVIITVVSLAPFFITFFWQAATGGFNWARVGEIKSDINWTVFLPTIAWNMEGLDLVGTVAEEVKKPQRTVLRAMVPLMVMVWLTYIPPAISAVSAQPTTNWDVWVTGYYATTAQMTAGAAGKYMMIIGGIVAALGQTMSNICGTSRMMAGMGQAVAFPRPINSFLGYYSPRFKTPILSIALISVTTAIVAALVNFQNLVGISQVIYGIRVIMIFLALIRLRMLHPALERPFRFPCQSNLALVAVLAIPLLYTVILTILAAMIDWETFWMCIGVFSGFALLSVIYVNLFRPEGFSGKIAYDEPVQAASLCAPPEHEA